MKSRIYKLDTVAGLPIYQVGHRWSLEPDSKNIQAAVIENDKGWAIERAMRRLGVEVSFVDPKEIEYINA